MPTLGCMDLRLLPSGVWDTGRAQPGCSGPFASVLEGGTGVVFLAVIDCYVCWLLRVRGSTGTQLWEMQIHPEALCNSLTITFISKARNNFSKS